MTLRTKRQRLPSRPLNQYQMEGRPLTVNVARDRTEASPARRTPSVAAAAVACPATAGRREAKARRAGASPPFALRLDVDLINEAISSAAMSERFPQLEGLSREQVGGIIEDFAKNWLAHDGLWFQAVEKVLGMDAAIAADAEAWRKFTVIEAKRIMERHGIPAAAAFRRW